MVVTSDYLKFIIIFVIISLRNVELYTGPITIRKEVYNEKSYYKYQFRYTTENSW